MSVEAVEALIRELPGVLGARLVINDWGGVREIHVLADAARPAKSVVRDIESALLARWHLQVDHKRISVAQVVGAPRRPASVRLRVGRLSVVTDGVRGETEVTVSLTPSGDEDAFARPAAEPAPAVETWEGRASGDASPGAPLRLTAAATVAALNQAVLRGHSFALVDAAPATVGGREVVNVLVRYRGPRGFGQLLAGAAVVRGGGLDVGVRAVLQATNRVAGLALRRGDEGAADEREDARVAEGDDGVDDEAAAEVAATQEAGDEGWPGALN